MDRCQESTEVGQNSSETSGNRESFTEDERTTDGRMEFELNATETCGFVYI